MPLYKQLKADFPEVQAVNASYTHGLVVIVSTKKRYGGFAKAVGLPDVIAHGMYTMAVAGRVVTDWAGDPGAVESYGVRFSRPVPVPDDDTGTTLRVAGTVEEKLGGGRVAVGLTATIGDGDDAQKVLTQARAVVRLT